MTCLNWGVAKFLLPGEAGCGDQHLVCFTPCGALMAVVDGLGHGEEAEAAARMAISVLEENADLDVITLVRLCHDKLRITRGVVMSIASFNSRAGVLSWIGVGNVGGLLLKAGRKSGNSTLLLRGGVVGGQLPTLLSVNLPVAEGDTLILKTDGVRDGFDRQLSLGTPPREIASWIMSQFATRTDEALVLVSQFTGEMQ
jgi:phosphoserine phosphatase RsbX